jgi:hypothetical protein
MLLQPVPAHTHASDEKVQTSHLAHGCAGFSLHPPRLSCPWIRPAMPLARHGLLLLHNNCGDPVVTHIPDQGMRCRKGKGPLPRGEAARFRSVLLFPSFFPAAFARQCFLHALFLAGFQIEGVTLDLLDDVLLLHLALEAAQCIFKGLTFLQSDFCQRNYTPKLVQVDCIVIARFCAEVKGCVESRRSTLLVRANCERTLSFAGEGACATPILGNY